MKTANTQQPHGSIHGSFDAQRLSGLSRGHGWCPSLLRHTTLFLSRIGFSVPPARWFSSGDCQFAHNTNSRMPFRRPEKNGYRTYTPFCVVSFVNPRDINSPNAHPCSPKKMTLQVNLLSYLSAVYDQSKRIPTWPHA